MSRKNGEQTRASWLVVAVIAVIAGWADTTALAQVIHHHHHYHGRPWAANIVVPQARSFIPHAGSIRRSTPNIEITSVDVGVVILEQAATTTMEISLRNLTGNRQEAEMVIPVPEGAAIRTFTFQGAAEESLVELLPKEEAKSAYSAIVAKVRDPALLEFIGYNLVRSSVFPVPPRGTQKIRLTYEHLCSAEGNRVDYVLPRTESIDYRIPWKVSVRVKSKRPISTIYSPSHQLDVSRVSRGVVSARIAAAATRVAGPFRLSYLMERPEGKGVTASLLAYPDPKIGGGYFLLLAGVPASIAGENEKDEKGMPAIRREVTLVLDRSGSMRGEKIEQVREAALQVIEGLQNGEAFNILVYNETVDWFSPRPVLVDREAMVQARRFLNDVKPHGGTNIHDALVEALRIKPLQEMLPIVLFLTDGLPTVGQTSEAAIRDAALKANSHNRRIFTFGAGLNVNTPLLEKIASETRATATFVLPKEDVEVKVGQVFKRLAGPVLADPEVEVQGEDASGSSLAVRASELHPARLPDIFEDDQLVLLGKYRGEEPLLFQLAGNYLGKKRTFRFRFQLDGASTRNSFVPRLWASRKIALLLDSIRQLGATGSSTPSISASSVSSSDPRLKELVHEIVNLSTEFGILTEYTAFLAREGTDLSRRDVVLAEATRNFQGRAIRTRTGLAGVNQEMNGQFMRGQSFLNGSNDYWDANMNRVQITTVQQVNDLAFYHRGNRWVDSRIVNQEKELKPHQTIEFGSEAFRELAEKLARQNRNGSIALRGDILMVVEGKPVLVKGAAR